MIKELDELTKEVAALALSQAASHALNNPNYIDAEHIEGVDHVRAVISSPSSEDVLGSSA